MSALYMNALGYTTQRPANFPALDRRALMIEAHQIAKRFQEHLGSYRAALSYGLKTAHKGDWINRTRRSLALECADGIKKQIEAGRKPARRQPMLGHYGYAGA